MVDFLDWLYLKFVKFGKAPKLNEWKIIPEQIERESDTYWICFIPYGVKFYIGITPKHGNVIKYILPPNAISPDAKQTYNSLFKIACHAQSKIKKLKNKKINLLGVSSGNAVTFWLVGKTKFNLNKIVCVSPGWDIVKCLLQSAANRELIKKVEASGKISQEIFSIFEEFSPANYMKKLRKNAQIEIYHGGKDELIPREQTDILIRELKKHTKNIKVIFYKGAGHAITIWKFARNWNKQT